MKKNAITVMADRAMRNIANQKPVKTLKLSIHPRRPKRGYGSAVVYVKLKYGDQLYCASTGVRCTWGKFDTKTLTIEGDVENSKILAILKNDINAAYADFKLTGREINLKLLWHVANGQTLEDPTPGLLKCIDLFMDMQQDTVATGGLDPRRMHKLKVWHRRISEFCLHRFGGQYVKIEDVKPADAQAFLLWLKKDCDYSQNSASPIVSHWKRILNFALENEWIVRNPFLNFRKNLEKKSVVSLTEKELEEIRTVELFSPVLHHTRQVFCFQAMTGLSYIDVTQVTTDNILVDEKTGIEFLEVKRSKTGIISIIPLTYEARKIIDSFADHPSRQKKRLHIPTLSNQKYNQWLKALGGMLKIKKRMTSHLARRTAATLYLNRGTPLESVSALLGHAHLSTTQDSYAKVGPDRVIRDLGAVTKLSKAN